MGFVSKAQLWDSEGHLKGQLTGASTAARGCLHVTWRVGPSVMMSSAWVGCVCRTTIQASGTFFSKHPSRVPRTGEQPA